MKSLITKFDTGKIMTLALPDQFVPFVYRTCIAYQFDLNIDLKLW